MNSLSSVRFLILSAALFAISRTTISHEDPELAHQKPFTYEEEEVKGPQNWGAIKSEWEVCGNGKMQSPIDIVNDRVTIMHSLGALQTMYKPAPATISNRGHDISVSWKCDAGGVIINDTFYELVQVHWHSPSEHTFNGRRYALEGHIVHKSAESGIAVIGVIYELGCANSFLDKVLSLGDTITEEGIDVGIVHPREVQFDEQEYYRYIGSLTTPPCTEGVIWTLVKKVETVSLDQLYVLREAVHDGYENNARPVQDAHGRQIKAITNIL